MILLAPIVAGFFSILGYFSTSQALLARLETSVAIWFVILIVYHTIRRWMSMRRKLAFERAKQRRAEILAQRAKGEDDNQQANASSEGNIDIEEQVIDLEYPIRWVSSFDFNHDCLGLIDLAVVRATYRILFLENIRLWDDING